MKHLSKAVLLLLLLFPLTFSFPAKATNSGPIFENIYLRVAPSTDDGVIDLYYKDKFGNWKIFNSITPMLKVGDTTETAEGSKIGFSGEQLTDGLSSRPDLTRVKLQFGTFKNGGHIYLMMDLEQGKPYVKFSAYKNTDSSELQEVSLAMTGNLTEFVQKIKVNATTYDATSCGTYSPGCSDIRTINDQQEFTLNKPDNKILTLVGETGIKQLLFFDQDFQTTDKLVAVVSTKGASNTNSSATSSAKRKEEPWFGKVYFTRSPFSADVNNWYFGVDTDSVKADVTPTPKEKRNLSFRVKFAGIEKNVGSKQVSVKVKSGSSLVLDRKVSIVGTSSGVYVGTLQDLPGKTSLQVFIKGPKHLTSKFDLPVGVETVDWTTTPLKGGDANGDDKVDSTDFSLLQRDYLQNITSGADFNYDTRVDSADFGIIQGGYAVKAAKP